MKSCCWWNWSIQSALIYLFRPPVGCEPCFVQDLPTRYQICFAVWIISLIVLIVPLSDVVTTLFLIPSHVTIVSHLMLNLILQSWQSHLAANIAPGSHWNWSWNEYRCMWGLFGADKLVLYTIFYFSSSLKSELQIVGWLKEVLPLAEMWESAAVPRALHVNWNFSMQQ